MQEADLVRVNSGGDYGKPREPKGSAKKRLIRFQLRSTGDLRQLCSAAWDLAAREGSARTVALTDGGLVKVR